MHARDSAYASMTWQTYDRYVARRLVRWWDYSASEAKRLVKRWQKLVHLRWRKGKSARSTARHVHRFEEERAVSPYRGRDSGRPRARARVGRWRLEIK